MNRLIALVLILTPWIMHPMEPATLETQYLEEELHTPAQLSLRCEKVYAFDSAEFSPAGDKIVTTSNDKTARIWDAETGNLIHTLSGHTEHIRSAKFSPTGDKIVTCSDDKTARIWNTETGKLIYVLGGSVGTNFLHSLIAYVWNNGHADFVTSAIFSPTGDKIATCSYDRTAKLWDAETGKLIHTLRQPFGQSALTVTFNLAGDQLVVGSMLNAIIWDTETGKCLKHPLSDHLVSNVIFNPAGDQVLTISLGTAALWHIPTSNQIVMGSVNTELDTEKIKPFHKLEGPPDINSATFNSEGNKVLVRSSSTAKLWDTATGKLIREFKGYTSTIISAMFNSTGDKMLICSSGSVLKTTDSYDSDTTIQIWDTETGRLLHNFKGCTSALTVALLAPEGDKVLTASVDGTVIMWLFN